MGRLAPLLASPGREHPSLLALVVAVLLSALMWAWVSRMRRKRLSSPASVDLTPVQAAPHCPHDHRPQRRLRLWMVSGIIIGKPSFHSVSISSSMGHGRSLLAGIAPSWLGTSSPAPKPQTAYPVSNSQLFKSSSPGQGTGESPSVPFRGAEGLHAAGTLQPQPQQVVSDVKSTTSTNYALFNISLTFSFSSPCKCGKGPCG
jgi:hypothetical protein